MHINYPTFQQRTYFIPMHWRHVRWQLMKWQHMQEKGKTRRSRLEKVWPPSKAVYKIKICQQLFGMENSIHYIRFTDEIWRIYFKVKLIPKHPRCSIIRGGLYYLVHHALKINNLSVRSNNSLQVTVSLVITHFLYHQNTSF